MPGEADWRDPGGYEPDEALDWPAIAMGYLARNAHYRADRAEALHRVTSGSENAATATAALIDRWGISLPVDPGREPNLRDVVIRPERSPIVVTLVAAPNPIGSLALPSFDGIDFAMRFDDGIYVVLHSASGDHRLWSTGSRIDALAFLLPLDARAGTRLIAADRLFRRMNGLAEGPSSLLPTALKLRRHLRLFRLLDGRRAGARARLLASIFDRSPSGKLLRCGMGGLPRAKADRTLDERGYSLERYRLPRVALGRRLTTRICPITQADQISG